MLFVEIQKREQVAADYNTHKHSIGISMKIPIKASVVDKNQ